MAGIHLPDIGKLGIRVATGIKDSKRVAPSNMAEKARLRAISNRLDTERQERYRVLKKEERRMKRRKQRIDERLEDISKSRILAMEVEGRRMKKNIKPERVSRLPPIAHQNHSYSQADDEEIVSELPAFSSAIFPIQEDIRKANLTNRKHKQYRGKTVLPPLTSTSNEYTDQQATKRGASNRNHSSKAEFKLDDFSAVLKSPAVKVLKEEEHLLRRDYSEGISSKPVLQLESGEDDVFSMKDNSTASRSISLADVSDASSFLFGSFPGRRRSSAQQSLEDALRAIKTCRYLRTPSRRNTLNELEVVYGDYSEEFTQSP